MKALSNKLHAALRWSEKYTKTDMVYLVHGSAWSVAAQISTAAASFALAVAVSRFVSKDAYGIYKYVLSAIAILSTFSLNSIGTAVLQSVAGGHDGALQEGFWQNIRWSALVFAGSLALAIYYFLLHNPILALGILISGCASPFLVSANLAGSFLAGKKDFARQAIYFGIYGSCIPLLSLVAAVFVSQNPLWLVIVYSITNVGSSLYFYKRTLAIYNPDSVKKDPLMMRYGKHLSLIGILGGIAGNLDQVLIFHYVGAAELAIYNFSTAILDQIGGPLKNISTMTIARFAGHSDENIRKNIWNKVWWWFVLGLFIIAVYIPLAPFIYKILFSGYTDAVPYSQVYALSMIALIFSPFGAYLTAKKKIKEQYIQSVSNNIIQIIVMTVATMYWGLWGLIWARVFLRTVGSLPLVLLYYLSKED